MAGKASETDFVQQTVRDVMEPVHYGQAARRRCTAWASAARWPSTSASLTATCIRGVATTGAVAGQPGKDKVANQPLSFFVVAGGKDPLLKEVQETKKKLAGKKFSVVYREIADMGHQYLDRRRCEELVRWIDSLDRQ